MKDRMIITHDHFVGLIDNIAEQIIEHNKRSNRKIDLVLGIPRGGLVPAVYLSHRVPNLTLAFDFDIILNHLKFGYKALIIDDICDSGATFKEEYNYLVHKRPEIQDEAERNDKSLFFASLIHNHENQFSMTSDFTAWTIKRSDVPQWFVFPWEKI